MDRELETPAGILGLDGPGEMKDDRPTLI